MGGGRTKVRIYCEIKPTEDRKKVLKALANVFDIKVAEKKSEEATLLGSRIVFEGGLELLNKLRLKLRLRHSQELFRNMLMRNRLHNSTYLLLNKQAAFAGHPIPCDSPSESPLGPITLEIEAEREDDVLAAINWLTA